MKRLCPSCQTLRPEHALACSCGHDLADAPLVDDAFEPASSDDYRGSARGEPPDDQKADEPCTCAFPEGEVGEIHFSCGRRIVEPKPEDWSDDSFQRSSESRRDESPRHDPVAARLLLPGGVYASVVDGCLLGRGDDEAYHGIAAVLRPFLGVSRHHAWIGSISGEVVVIDLGSRNGTWIENQRLTPWKPQVLDSKTEVRIGLGSNATVVLQWE